MTKKREDFSFSSFSALKQEARVSFQFKISNIWDNINSLEFYICHGIVGTKITIVFLNNAILTTYQIYQFCHYI